MNEEIKAKWLEALRSGRYKQGTYALRKGNEFCCLGVLCDIVEPGAWVECGYGRYLHSGEDALPAAKITIGVELEDYMAQKLADMNDSGQTFEEIAHCIEQDA